MGLFMPMKLLRTLTLMMFISLSLNCLLWKTLAIGEVGIVMNGMI